MGGYRRNLCGDIIQPEANYLGVPIRVTLLELLQGSLGLKILWQGFGGLVTAVQLVSLLDEIVDLNILVIRPFRPRARQSQEQGNADCKPFHGSQGSPDVTGLAMVSSRGNLTLLARLGTLEPINGRQLPDFPSAPQKGNQPGYALPPPTARPARPV